jgi:hypothetical protein
VSDDAMTEVQPVNGSAITQIVTKACSKCQFSAEEKPDLVCRRYPMQVTFLVVPRQIMIPGPHGPRAAVQPCPVPHSAFPVMRPDQWCGEFRFRGSQ